MKFFFLNSASTYLPTIIFSLLLGNSLTFQKPVCHKHKANLDIRMPTNGVTNASGI